MKEETKPEAVETKEKKVRVMHPYQVPEHLFQLLEKKARIRRKKTGQSVLWSEVLREILEKKLIKNSEN